MASIAVVSTSTVSDDRFSDDPTIGRHGLFTISISEKQNDAAFQRMKADLVEVSSNDTTTTPKRKSAYTSSIPAATETRTISKHTKSVNKHAKNPLLKTVSAIMVKKNNNLNFTVKIAVA